jgi:hypothetical protein
MTNRWHDTLVIAVFNKLHKHFLKFQIQELLIEVALRPRLSMVFVSNAYQ